MEQAKVAELDGSKWGLIKQTVKVGGRSQEMEIECLATCASSSEEKTKGGSRH